MRNIDLSGDTKDRSLIFVFPKPMIEGKQWGVVFIWKKVVVFLVVWHYLHPRAKNFKLGVRSLHGTSSAVK